MHSDIASLMELGAHIGTPWGHSQAEQANSTQKHPFADPTQGIGTDDMEEGTHHTVPSAGIEPRTFLL